MRCSRLVPFLVQHDSLLQQFSVPPDREQIFLAHVHQGRDGVGGIAIDGHNHIPWLQPGLLLRTVTRRTPLPVSDCRSQAASGAAVYTPRGPPSSLVSKRAKKTA